MRNQAPQAANWDWLANPQEAFELHSAERKAYYVWQSVVREWSEVTGHMDSSAVEGLTKEQRESLEALKERLDEAAKVYERARKKLHEAWSA